MGFQVGRFEILIILANKTEGGVWFVSNEMSLESNILGKGAG